MGQSNWTQTFNMPLSTTYSCTVCSHAQPHTCEHMYTHTQHTNIQTRCAKVKMFELVNGGHGCLWVWSVPYRIAYMTHFNSESFTYIAMVSQTIWPTESSQMFI